MNRQRTALITGAAGGLGQAMVWALAETGFQLALHYRSSQEAVVQLAQSLADAGHVAHTVQADLAQIDGASRSAKEATAALGPIDVLVHNAGGWVEKPLLETTVEEWDDLIDTDLRSAFLLSRALAPAMVAQGWGRIVNISSIASLGYVPNEGLYGIAKAGINALTKTLGAELAPHGVTVNAVAPGWTLPHDTPYPPEPSDYPQCVDVPNGRPGHAREVAALVQYLVSDAAAHMTGQILPIDGGLSSLIAKGR